MMHLEYYRRFHAKFNMRRAEFCGGEGERNEKERGGKGGGGRDELLQETPRSEPRFKTPPGKYPSPSSNLFRPLPPSVLLILDSNQFQIKLGTLGLRVEKIGRLIVMSKKEGGCENEKGVVEGGGWRGGILCMYLYAYSMKIIF